MELVVVMAIIAIGAVLATPNIGAWIPNYRLRGVTREIVSVMRTAQIKSVSTNAWYRVTFEPASRRYFIESSQDFGANWVKEGEYLTLPNGINISLTTFAGGVAVFYPNSSATNGSVTLVNTKGSQKTVHLLGTTGRIKHE